MTIDQELYQQIVRVMPLACVDLVVVDDRDRILLAKRANEPASGEWWFPGGRVHFLETRLSAAARKLREEFGMESSRWFELGTYDVMVGRDDGSKSHGITTLFVARIDQPKEITLDFQNSIAEWRSPRDWLQNPLPDFIRQGINDYLKFANKE